MPSKTAPKKPQTKHEQTPPVAPQPAPQPVAEVAEETSTLKWRDLDPTHQKIVSAAIGVKPDGGNIPSQYEGRIRKALEFMDGLKSLHTATSIPLVATMTDAILKGE